MNTRQALYINGAWQDATAPAETFTVINPASEEPLAAVGLASRGDTDRAVQAARRAFPAWSSLRLVDRLSHLRRLHEVYLAHADEIAATITAELGAPVPLCREHHTTMPAEVMAAAIEIAADYPYDSRVDDSLITREPVGVVAAVTPWNDPMMLSLIKVVPALAAGCTVVHKPAELTALTGLKLAELVHEADLPAGVFNTVVGLGAEAGDQLDGHPDVDMVAFTGSTGAGRRVMTAAASNIKRILLELGGKSASLVLDDADVAQIAHDQIIDTCRNSGQFCGAMTRLLVPAARMDEAADAARAGAGEIIVGDPTDPATTMGPVISAHQRDTIRDYIAAGISDGFSLVTGGPQAPEGLDRGFYLTPTVFANVDNRSRIAQEEIFGPVLVIIGYTDDDDAITQANHSIYGLRGTVWSADPDRALAVARRLRAGQIDINGFKFGLHAPFGGYKQSGTGRTMGTAGYEEFLQTKAIQL